MTGFVYRYPRFNFLPVNFFPIDIYFFCVCFLWQGLCIAIPGPTLIDLQERIHTDTTHMALIFTARSVGYLLGSLVGGFLFDHFDKQLLLMVTLIVAAMATSIIPWSLTLAVLTVLMSLQGMSMGVLDTGKTVFFTMRATVLLLIYLLHSEGYCAATDISVEVREIQFDITEWPYFGCYIWIYWLWPASKYP